MEGISLPSPTPTSGFDSLFSEVEAGTIQERRSPGEGPDTTKSLGVSLKNPSMEVLTENLKDKAGNEKNKRKERRKEKIKNTFRDPSTVVSLNMNPRVTVSETTKARKKYKLPIRHA